MIIPTDKETKCIKDRNVDTQEYSEHEITKMKTEYTNLMWWNKKVNNMDSKKSTDLESSKNHCALKINFEI